MHEVTLEELQKFSKNKNSGIQQPPTVDIDKPVEAKSITPAPAINNKQTIVETPMIQNAFSDMLNTIENKKKQYDEQVATIIEKNKEEMEEAEMLGIDTTKERLDDKATQEKIKEAKEKMNNESNINTFDTTDIDTYVGNTNEVEYREVEETPAPAVASTKNEKETEEDNEDLDSLMKDLNESDDTSDIKDEESVDEIRTRFKESLSDVKITKDAIDFTKFKIAQKPISSLSALSDINSKIKSFKKADWVLFHTGRSITFAECKGTELNNLRKTIDSSNEINSVIASLRFIYDHVIDANKAPFEQWCKLIRTEDIESLYFGLYRACYADSNIIARTCPNNKCEKTSLINIDISKMVKYEDDETKEKFDKIFHQDTTTSTHMHESELLQISDDLAISYNYATLYSTFLQYASLPENITKKYSDTLNTMAYIDGFFKINRENNTLDPIEIKTYRNNINKTVVNKLKVYIEILKTLTNDQYNVLMAKLNSIITNPKVTYIYPETTCPECGDTIPEAPIDSMLRMLFTRAQLVQVKSL